MHVPMIFMWTEVLVCWMCLLKFKANKWLSHWWHQTTNGTITQKEKGTPEGFIFKTCNEFIQHAQDDCMHVVACLLFWTQAENVSEAAGPTSLYSVENTSEHILGVTRCPRMWVIFLVENISSQWMRHTFCNYLSITSLTSTRATLSSNFSMIVN